MFEEASRMKIRFDTTRGKISTEDLWDLPLTELDTIAVDLRKAIDERPKVSFITKSKPRKDKVLAIKFAVVKAIIDTLLAEADIKAKQADNKAQKEKILRILEAKEEEDLRSMSKKDLKKMVKSL